MARQWRIEYPGAIYHVLSRGNNRQDVFLSDDDRYRFLDCLAELADRFELKLYAYVLMSNHYHLLLKTIDANLSRAMQWLGTRYTILFHRSNHTGGGHLFQGRFKSIVVENDAYLLRLSCYIHRNPIRAGIVQRLADYRWSSYRFYAYKKKTPDWLNTATIFNQLSAQDRCKAYRIKVQQYSDERGSLWEDVKHGLIYGGQEFVADLKARFLHDKKDPELPQHNRLLKQVEPELMLEKASEFLGFDVETVRSAKRIRPEVKDQRDMLVYWFSRTGRLSNQEIGSLFGLSYSAVSKIKGGFQKRLLTETKLKEQADMLYSLFKV